jgi:hypothetical protein
MKQTVSFYDFERAFVDMGRKDSFSYAGLRALFDDLEEYEAIIGEEIELDVISLCGEYSEYSSAVEAAQQYDYEPNPDDDEDEAEERALRWLGNHTTVIEFPGGVIIENF